jgi:hypothetical protein
MHFLYMHGRKRSDDTEKRDRERRRQDAVAFLDSMGSGCDSPRLEYYRRGASADGDLLRYYRAVELC